jgi:hypothetical protein
MQQESWVNPEAVIDRHMFSALDRMIEKRRRAQQQGLQAEPQPQAPAPSQALQPEPSPADTADKA